MKTSVQCLAQRTPSINVKQLRLNSRGEGERAVCLFNKHFSEHLLYEGIPADIGWRGASKTHWTLKSVAEEKNKTTTER